jgi:hypothetical protein
MIFEYKIMGLPYEISQILGIKPKILEWPGVLVNFILPFILFSYALKCVLEKLKIFRSPTVYWGIALIIAFITLVFIPGIGHFAAAFSIFATCILKLGMGLKGVLVGIIVAVIYFTLAIPFLISILAQLS